jgi:hypothetical protein
MEATKSEDHDSIAPQLSNSHKLNITKGNIQNSCCQKNFIGKSPEKDGEQVSISDELRDRLCLKGVNGLVVNGLDTHTDITDPSPIASGECSSQNSSNNNNNIVDSVNDSVPYNSEESSGYSSSHEESRMSKVQRPAVSAETEESPDSDIVYVSYESELQMPDIMRLIQKDLSEPYSIYTYRYFIHNWPKLCFLVCMNNSNNTIYEPDSPMAHWHKGPNIMTTGHRWVMLMNIYFLFLSNLQYHNYISSQ